MPKETWAIGSAASALDPRTGDLAGPFGPNACDDWFLAMAVAPGGLSVDPWSHRLVGDPSPQPLNVVLPDLPKPSTGGAAVVPELTPIGHTARRDVPSVWFAGLAMFACPVIRRRNASCA